MTFMPRQTQRAHSDPSWHGDRLAALDEVARQPKGPDGIRAADRNMQWAWHDPKDHSKGGVAFCMHWGNAAQNNYLHIAVSATHTRPMTGRERSRSINDWPAADVRRWRRTASVHSERPPTYAAMVRRAVAVGVIITAELKSSAFAQAGPAQQVVNAAVRAGHPPWFMALWSSMPKCRAKCSAVIRAGGQFAVILGNYQSRRPAFHVAVKFWNPPPTREW